MWDWVVNPILALCLLLGLALIVLFPPFLRRLAVAWRGRRRPVPREQLTPYCPQHLQLNDAQWLRLGRQVARFNAHKRYVGCAGLTVDDETRLAVAVPACLLCLFGPEKLPYPKLRYIQLFPVEWTPHARWQDAELPPSPGRAAWRGTRRRVLLAYSTRQQVAYDFNGGRNASLYELINAGTKRRGGEPLLHSRGAFGTWALLRCRHDSLRFDPIFTRSETLAAYEFTAAAELFAAAVESFMREPLDFAAEHPELCRAVRQQLGLADH